MTAENRDDWLLSMRSHLSHNVPRFIKHIKQRGGVTREEWDWIRCEDDETDYPMSMILRADEYLLYPQDEETFQKGLFVLVKALAILSFIPEGVRIFGLHFCDKIDNFFALENDDKET